MVVVLLQHFARDISPGTAVTLMLLALATASAERQYRQRR
jgi:hypothetical protein